MKTASFKMCNWYSDLNRMKYKDFKLHNC